MVSPFEIFRKPLNLYRFIAGSYINGQWIEGGSVTMSTNMITGNVLNLGLIINGVVTGWVQSFSISQENTMNLLKNSLKTIPGIRDVFISENFLSFVIISENNVFIEIPYANMFGGISQPITTIQNNPQKLLITASVQPARGEELMSLPEGRRERIKYALFTSTPIELIHDSVNPDQIEIYGERYEVVQVEIWQNNPSVFGIVNHYKFFAMALEAIP